MGQQAAVRALRELDGGRVVAAGGVFEASAPFHAFGNDCPWALAERAKMLARRRDVARRRDAAAVLQGLVSPQGVLDVEEADVMRVIREAMRTHEETFGVAIRHGACSPETFVWLAFNAARHGWCKPGHPVPCVSGVGQMPDGTGMLVAIDAHMPRGRVVLSQPDALYRFEGKKSTEGQMNGGRVELRVRDAYGLVGVRREVETGAKTSIAFDMVLPGTGQAPGPASRGCPPAEAPRAGMTARRRFGGLPEWVDGWIARQSILELAVARAFQLLAEESGGTVVTVAGPSALSRARPRPPPPLLAPPCPVPAA